MDLNYIIMALLASLYIMLQITAAASSFSLLLVSIYLRFPINIYIENGIVRQDLYHVQIVRLLLKFRLYSYYLPRSIRYGFILYVSIQDLCSAELPTDMLRIMLGRVTCTWTYGDVMRNTASRIYSSSLNTN